MKDKIFKAIKCVLFMLPFVFVGGKTLYTILNDNAKDSFSLSYVSQPVKITSDTAVIDNRILTMTYDSNHTAVGESWVFGFKSVNYDLSTLPFYPTYNAIKFVNNYVQFLVFDWSTNTANNYTNVTTLNTITFTSNGLKYFRGYGSLFGWFTAEYNLMVTDTLDNAFEYGLSEFNNIGFGKIDFLEWFNNMFLNNNFNNVYSTFINSYINYFLFVELVMFIPSVFHWVIHFFTEIGNNALSRSTKKEKGDD